MISGATDSGRNSLTPGITSAFRGFWRTVSVGGDWMIVTLWTMSMKKGADHCHQRDSDTDVGQRAPAAFRRRKPGEQGASASGVDRQQGAGNLERVGQYPPSVEGDRHGRVGQDPGENPE